MSNPEGYSLKKVVLLGTRIKGDMAQESTSMELNSIKRWGEGTQEHQQDWLNFLPNE